MRFLLLLLLPLISNAQYREVSGDFFPNAKVEKSYLVNGYFEKNLGAVVTSVHSATRNTSSPIQGAGDLQITASGAGFTRINTLAWEKRLEGQNCELSFKYVGGGGGWTAEIWDGSLNVLVSRPLPAVTLVSPISINYPCGSTSGRTIRFVTTASAPQLNVDEIYYGIATNIITLANQTGWISYTPTITAASGTLTNFTLMGTEYMIDGVNLYLRGQLAFTGSPGTWQNPRVSLPSPFVITAGYVNQTFLNQIVLIDTGTNSFTAQTNITNGDAFFRIGGQNGAANEGTTIANNAPFTWASGDIITWMVGPIPVNGLSATQQAVTQACIQDGSCENVFSAYTDTVGVVSLENVNWINGNPTLVNSTYTYTFVSGFFGAAPNCSIASANGANLLANIVTVTASQMTVRMFNPSNNVNATGVDFRIVCHRSGTDYKPRFAAPIVTGSVTSASASPLRMETAYIQTNGNVLFGSTPGFFSCGATLPRTCTFAQPFAANPVCTATMDGRARIAAVASVTTTAVILEAGDLTGSLSNTNNMHLICIGPRLQ